MKLNFLNNSFTNNVVKLVSGTATSQVIGFITIPILARVYSQEAFGLFAIFGALVGFISSFATLKYDTALVLPKKDADAYALLKLSNICTFIITILAVSALYLPINYFDQYRGIELLIGFGVIAAVNFNNSSLWNIRFKSFSHTAFASVIQSICIFIFQYLLYTFYNLKGLIIGNIIGMACSGLYLIVTRKFDWLFYFSISKATMSRQAKRYIDFPKYFTVANAILSFSASLPILLFAKFIPLSQIGLYGMALKIISQPVSLIANSVRSVILSDMAEKKNHSQPILRWYTKVTLGLLSASLLISIALYLMADYIILIFLGEDWIKTATYAKLLIPLFIGLMIGAPGIAAVRVFELQKYNFNYSIISLIIKASALLFMFKLESLSFENIILIYAFINFLIIVANNLYIYKKIVSYETAI